jgi:ribosomal protein S18 acetylase RimI-like enzyme
MLVRGRTDDDLGRLELLAQAVHEVDRYPVRLPADMRSFLTPPDEYSAWVAEAEGEVVGHVALRARCTSPGLEVACCATGRHEGDFGVVARLMVSPAARHRGAGQALLRTAADEAVARGLVPILEVVTSQRAAVRLYEALGWARAGTATLAIPDGLVLDLFVYVFSPPE